MQRSQPSLVEWRQPLWKVWGRAKNYPSLWLLLGHYHYHTLMETHDDYTVIGCIMVAIFLVIIIILHILFLWLQYCHHEHYHYRCFCYCEYIVQYYFLKTITVFIIVITIIAISYLPIVHNYTDNIDYGDENKHTNNIRNNNDTNMYQY